MSLRLMFSGTYTNLFDARFCSFSLSFHFHIVILLSFTLQFCEFSKLTMDYIFWLGSTILKVGVIWLDL